MGFASVAGAVVMATGADPNLLGESPLWGIAPHRERRLPLRTTLRGRRRRRRDARGRLRDRRPQRLLHRPLQDARLHGDAGVADAVRRSRRSGSRNRRTSSTCRRTSLDSAPATSSRSISARRSRRRSSGATSFPSSPIRWLIAVALGLVRRDHAAQDRFRPSHLCGRDEPGGSGDLGRSDPPRHHPRLRVLRLLRRGRRNPLFGSPRRRPADHRIGHGAARHHRRDGDRGNEPRRRQGQGQSGR